MSTRAPRIKRIVIADCEASGAPSEPEFELFDYFPLTENGPDVTERVAAAFAEQSGDKAQELPLQTASEDFSDLPRAIGVPYACWGLGGTGPSSTNERRRPVGSTKDVPVNHPADFALVLQPLDTGTRAMTVAALAWLGHDL